MMLRILVVLLFVAAPVLAGPREDFEKLAGSLRDANALVVELEQRAYNAFLGEETERQGRLTVSQGGLLRWEYLDEPRQVIVMDANYVWFHEIGKRTVRRGSVGDGQYKTLIRALFGDIPALESLFRIDADAEGDTVTVKLTPRATMADVKTASLQFDAGATMYTEVTFVDHYDQSSRLVIGSVERNPTLPEGVFTFTPPENMKLVGFDGEPLD